MIGGGERRIKGGGAPANELLGWEVFDGGMNEGMRLRFCTEWCKEWAHP